MSWSYILPGPYLRLFAFQDSLARLILIIIFPSMLARAVLGGSDIATGTNLVICDTMRPTRDDLMTRLLLTSLLLLALSAVASPIRSVAGVHPQTAGDPLPYDLGDGPSSITIVDLNRDYRPELVVTNRHTNTVSVLLNNRNGSFALKSRYPTGLAPSAVVSADFNKDGKPDIVVANSGSDTVSIFLGNGDGTLTRTKDYQTGAVPGAVVVADLNRDNSADLVVANRYGNSVSVLLGKGDGTFYAKTDYATCSLPYSVVLDDVNRDGKQDLLVTSCFDHIVSMLSGNGDGTFRPTVRYARAKRSFGVVLSDLDGDDRPGLVELHRYGYLISIQLVREDGSPRVRREYLAGKGPRCVLSADFNADGIADLAVANAGHNPGESGSVFIFLGKGNGAFEAKTSYVTGSASHSLALGDLNGDGKIDMAVLNSSYDFGGSVSVLFGNGDGTFGGRVDYATGGYLIWVSFGEDAGGSVRDVVWAEKPPEK
jgi:FG-GAP-like repeat